LPSLPICQVIRLGTVDYQQAWDLQVRLAQGVRSAEQPNTLLLLEHPPVYTRGRLSQPGHILLTPGQLRERGISVYDTDRGGQVTYHGPGQLVGYPVVDLREWGGPLQYVRTLERIIVSTLADFQIQAGVVQGLTGVWAGGGKVAAIGLKISRGVAYHGFAINVNTDLSYYDHIVPCGIDDRPVTSMAQVLGHPVDQDTVNYSLVYQFGKGMGFRMVEVEEAAGVSHGSIA
jgi:lipoate-protein ligase B